MANKGPLPAYILSVDDEQSGGAFLYNVDQKPEFPLSSDSFPPTWSTRFDSSFVSSPWPTRFNHKYLHQYRVGHGTPSTQVMPRTSFLPIRPRPRLVSQFIPGTTLSSPMNSHVSSSTSLTSSSFAFVSSSTIPFARACVSDDREVLQGASTISSRVGVRQQFVEVQKGSRKRGPREVHLDVRETRDESFQRKKRYTENEVRDLVHLRLEMQAEFETMSTRQDLWTDIGVKMVAKGHPERPWESYREKWGDEMQRYQRLRREKLEQSRFGSSIEEDGFSLLVFEDDILNDIHRAQSHYQSGPSVAREPTCSEETPEPTQLGGKRKRSNSGQSSSEECAMFSSTLDRVEKVDMMGTSESWRELLNGIASLTQSKTRDSALGSIGSEKMEPLDERVKEWLQSIGRERYAYHFAKMGVDRVSIMYLQELDLLEKSGIPIAVSRHLWAEIQKLQSNRGFEN